MVRRRIRGVVDVERRVGWQTTDLVLTTEICGGRKKKDVVMSESENLMGKRDTRGKFWVRTEHKHGFCTGKGDTCKATNI